MATIDEEKAQKQQLLNTAVAHIRKQGAPSGHIDERNRFVCSYRSPTGFQCAAAPFIRDYHSGMEDWKFTRLARDFAAKLDPVAVEHSDFVESIQYCHDSPASAKSPTFMQDFEERVAELARRHGLTVPAAA